MAIDIAFDFRTDTPPGLDPDMHSPTLRRYHAYLWGRPLPNGSPFPLDASAPLRKRYLVHHSQLGTFHLTSDSAIPSYRRWKRRHVQELLAQIPEDEVTTFRDLGHTIGGTMLWPKVSPSQHMSINQARGWLSREIGDRLDLTLEALRRFYLGQASPLLPHFAESAAFFALFENFSGFIEHFLLQDLVSDDHSQIRFFLPFDDFTRSAIPADVASYRAYRAASMEFVHARNERIATLARHLAPSQGDSL